MNHNNLDQLCHRRIEVEKTLRHLENERRTVECNTEWANRTAFDSRMNLLYSLTDSFRNEISRINDALKLRDPRRYGLCLSCHDPIEAGRLRICPEAEFCFECQQYAKGSQPAEPFDPMALHSVRQTA